VANFEYVLVDAAICAPYGRLKNIASITPALVIILGVFIIERNAGTGILKAAI